VVVSSPSTYRPAEVDCATDAIFEPLVVVPSPVQPTVVGGTVNILAPLVLRAEPIQPTANADVHDDSAPLQLFVDTFKKGLDQPLLSTPILRATRRNRSVVDDDFVPKRSTRLIAKSGFRELRPEAEA
jgi:hypothetical protein